MGAPWRHERLPESQATEAFMPSWTKEKKGRGGMSKGRKIIHRTMERENFFFLIFVKEIFVTPRKVFFMLKNIYIYVYRYQFSSVQLLSRVWLFATPWTAAHQVFLSITNSQSLLKLMSIDSAMPSNQLILCCSLIYLYVYNSSLLGRLPSKLF